MTTRLGAAESVRPLLGALGRVVVAFLQFLGSERLAIWGWEDAVRAQSDTPVRVTEDATLDPGTPNDSRSEGSTSHRLTAIRSAATANNKASIGSDGVNAISLNSRQASIACFKVEDNTTQAPSGIGVQVRQVSPATVSLERGDSSSNTASTVLAANNPSASGSTPTFVAGTVTVVNDGTCQSPP